MGLKLSLHHAHEVIDMDEHNPALAARSKKDSSMVVGMELVKHREADAFYTAGHSGGALAAALFRLGRIRGIKRPALSTIFPSQTPQGFAFSWILVPMPSASPSTSCQFAIMGSVYAERVLGVPTPRVAIVSNGEEEGKGNQLVRETVPLLKATALNFVGNAEGKDIPWGVADVIVTDGFTGNVIIKLSEGVARFLMDMLKDRDHDAQRVQGGGVVAQVRL